MIETAVNEAKNRRTLLLAEFVVIMALASPWLIAQFVGSSGHINGYVEGLSAVSATCRLLLIGFVVWVADGSLRAIGIARPKWVDIGLALAIFILVFLIGIAGFSIHKFPHFGYVPASVYMGVPLYLVIAGFIMRNLFKEVVFRGYIIGRLSELGVARWMCVTLSALFPSIVYWHDGLVPVLMTMMIYAAIGWAFLYTRRIWVGYLLVAGMEMITVIDAFYRLGGHP